jgi:hypothetical protein
MATGSAKADRLRGLLYIVSKNKLCRSDEPGEHAGNGVKNRPADHAPLDIMENGRL